MLGPPDLHNPPRPVRGGFLFLFPDPRTGGISGAFDVIPSFSGNSPKREVPRIPQHEREPHHRFRVEEDLLARVQRLARRAALSAGVQLAWTEVKGPRGSRRVRVFIEGPDDVPVGLPHCERMNEKLSALFDLEDPIPGSYVLEVSTPGLDRPLHSPADCQRFTGRRVRVKCRIGDRTRTVVGTLEAVETDAVRLGGHGVGPVEGQWIRWDAVVGARLDPDTRSLFAGRAPGRRGIPRGRRRPV